MRKMMMNILRLTLTNIAIIFYLSLVNSNSINAKEIPDFSELAEELIPAVVSVSVMISRETINQPRAPQFPPGSPFEEFFKDFFERRGIPRNSPPRQNRRSESAMGSGFIINKNKGYIVTNNHVIANASSITVVLHDGTSLQAKLIGTDAKTDLALLQVKTDIELTEVAWGNSNSIKVGKIQVSAALKIIFNGTNNERIWEELSQFNEPTYLHQVTEKLDGKVKTYIDLPLVLEGDRTHEELRAHYHVPIFLEKYGELFSTQDHILKTIAYIKEDPISEHLEVETYTWDVLPTDLKQDLSVSIIRELEWLKSHM